MQRYEDKKASSLQQNAVIEFVDGLRSMSQHHSLPRISAFWDPGNDRVRILISTDSLLEFGRWGMYAKQLIESSQGHIELKPIIEEYHNTVSAFHSWVDRQVEAIHEEGARDAIPLLLELNRKKELLAIEYLEQELDNPGEDILTNVRLIVSGMLNEEDSLQMMAIHHDAKEWLRAAVDLLEKRSYLPDAIIQRVRSEVIDR